MKLTQPAQNSGENPMEFHKTHGTAYKTSISPSRALINEAQRQVEAGMWESKTDFFEAGAWLLVETQSLGADLLGGPEDAPTDAHEVARSAARLELHVHEHTAPADTEPDDGD